MINKRGQGLSTNAIILIVLGVIILAMLIFAIGFTFRDRILPFISPPNNVDDVKDECNIACNTGGVYSFCTVKRTVIVENALKVRNNETLSTKFEGSCNDLVKVEALGISPCVSLSGEAGCSNPSVNNIHLLEPVDVSPAN